MSNSYSRTFYTDRQNDTLLSAQQVAPRLIDLVHPRKVVDIGCGTGDWLSAFLDLGVERVVGLDGDWVDEDLLHIPRESFLRTNLDRPIELDETFDMAISLEVAEHLLPERASGFVSDLVSLAPIILFSAAVPWQGGTGHVNEQWPAYWCDLFSEHGYRAIDALRWEIWTNEDICWWYAQNIILYASETAVDGNAALKDLAARSPDVPPAVVHPRMYATYADPERMYLSRWLRISPHFLKRLGRRVFRGKAHGCADMAGRPFKTIHPGRDEGERRG